MEDGRQLYWEQDSVDDGDFASSAEAEGAPRATDYDVDLPEDVLLAAQQANYDANYDATREPENLAQHYDMSGMDLEGTMGYEEGVAQRPCHLEFPIRISIGEKEPTFYVSKDMLVQDLCGRVCDFIGCHFNVDKCWLGRVPAKWSPWLPCRTMMHPPIIS